jgi:NADP-dependent 3-hydroxy acid dehydrogenase YdfG
MKKLKIAITGHTSGIGQALYTYLKEHGHDVRGFSRSTGHDLGETATISRLIEETADCDVFINNAYYDWTQVDLMFAMFENWKDQDRLILNIGSDSGDGIKTFMHPYATKKAAIDHGSAQLNAVQNARCRVTNLKPGWVRTPQIEHLKISEPQLDPVEVAKLVAYILELPKGMHISSLSVQARGNWD